MQGIYNYVPETNHVTWAYNVAAILQLCYGACNIVYVESFVILRLLLLPLSSLSLSLELKGWVIIF